MRPTISTAAPLVVVAVALASCASGPRIYSAVKPHADLSRYATYSYAASPGTDRPGGPTTLLTQYLKSAVDREMQARGYRYVAQDGDLLVNFYVETKEKIQSRTAPSAASVGGGYYGYRSGLYAGWHVYPETDLSQYTEGTLNIDVADAARRELVWEGVAIGRITEQARRNVQATVDAVVPVVFTEFPVGLPATP